jgi:hypothetical protein
MVADGVLSGVGRVRNTDGMADDPVQVQVRRLLDDALDSFDAPGVTTSALVRKAQRIAALRRDYAKQIAFILQTSDIASDMEDKNRTVLPIVLQVRAQLATLVGAAEEIGETERQYQSVQRTRRIKGGNFSGISVSQLEDNLNALERAYDDADPLPNLTPIDAAFAADRATKTRAQLLPDLQWTRGTLGKIRQDVHDYLVSGEQTSWPARRTATSFSAHSCISMERCRTTRQTR